MLISCLLVNLRVWHVSQGLLIIFKGKVSARNVEDWLFLMLRVLLVFVQGIIEDISRILKAVSVTQGLSTLILMEVI